MTASFEYDARNRCVSRAVNGSITYCFFDGWNLIEEHDGSDAQIARYVHGAATDEILARITTSAVTYYHHDGFGSTIALTGPGGILVERYLYDIYGAPAFKNSAGVTLPFSAIGNRFLFTGREYLSDLSLYDYRNRVYSSGLGRFLQTDPISFKVGDVSLYRYVANNPAGGTDPQGLFVGAVIGGVIGAPFGPPGVVGGAAIGTVIGAGVVAAIAMIIPSDTQAPRSDAPAPAPDYGPTDSDPWREPHYPDEPVPQTDPTPNEVRECPYVCCGEEFTFEVTGELCPEEFDCPEELGGQTSPLTDWVTVSR